MQEYKLKKAKVKIKKVTTKDRVKSNLQASKKIKYAVSTTKNQEKAQSKTDKSILIFLITLLL
jgi:ribosome-interacting GTPase 1